VNRNRGQKNFESFDYGYHYKPMGTTSVTKKCPVKVLEKCTRPPVAHPVAHRSSWYFGRFQSLLAFSMVLGSPSGLLLCGSSDYGQIPLAFAANRGQLHYSVRFTAKSPGFTVYFTPKEVVIDVLSATVRMRYLGASVSPDIEGLDLQEGKANYLIGNNPSNWKTNVPLFGRVIYKDLYPGIDMLYSSSARQLKSEFVVAPGADPSRIQIAYTGVVAIRIDDAGALIFATLGGELHEAVPEIYQQAAGRRESVKGAFRVSGDVVSFFVEEYDRSRELWIDPGLSYSTYLGGAGTNKGTAIAVDSSNAAYITGYSDSTNFPVTGGAVQTTSGGSADVFVTKLNSSGSAIVYSTYLGGNGDDRGFSIAVDRSGNAYVTGSTSSTNFPVVAALQTRAGGGATDAFVAKLNPTGSALVFSTYLGGTGIDSGNGIAVDDSGVYVTGSTTSANFPVAGAFQATLGGGQDGFVTKLNAAGSGIIYSTYLGGSLDDRGSSIALDSSGAAYVAGNTSSTNFPIASALQSSNGGASDAFVTKLSAAGNSLMYSTYLGGSGAENVELGRSIAVDSANSAYITGMTASANFPTFHPLQASLGGSNDAFVVKLNSAGTAFLYSTYLGGSSIDSGESIAVDSSGNAYVTGYTTSPDFPSVNADQPAIGGSYDAFISKLNISGSALMESDFLGGSGSDSGYGIALDSLAAAYMTGQTSSSNFPLKSPAQNGLGTTNLAAFVAKFIFGSNGPLTAVSVSPPGGFGASQTFTLVYSDTLGFADISWAEMNWSATQSTAGACYLHYDRTSNTIQLSNDAGSGWIGLATPTVAGTLQNSQCVIDAGASTVSGSGNNLTLNLVLTFKQAFIGAKISYLQVQNISSVLAPWQARGTWTVTASGPPNFTANPASLHFVAQAGSLAPSQNLTLTSSGAPLAYTLSSSVTSPAGGNWLQVPTQSGTTVSTIIVSVNAAGLAGGTYSGVINVSAPTAGNASLAVVVTLTVAAAGFPNFTANPASLHFVAQAGSIAPSQNLTLTSSGAPLAYTLSSSVTSPTGGNWLQVPTQSGTTGATVTVSVNTAGLAVGTYSGVINVSAPTAGNASLAVLVTLIVAAAGFPNFTANPASLHFVAQAGSIAPSQNLALTSSGAPLAYTLNSSVTSPTGGNWLQVPTQSGTTGATVTVSVNTAGLAVGTYTGVINVSAPTAGNGSLAVPVTLNIAPGPVLLFSVHSLSFAYQVGQAQPLSQTVTIGSTSGTVSYAVATQTGSMLPWLNVSSTSGTSPGNLVVNVNTTGLAIGTFTGTISLTPTGPNSNSQTIQVTLVISNSALFLVSPISPTFTTTIGSGGSSFQNLEVTSTDGTPLPFSVVASTSIGSNWLLVSLTSGISPTNLSITANPAALAVGTYTGTVTIAASSGSVANSPQTFPVTLNLVSANTLNVNATSLSFAQSANGSAPGPQTLSVTSTAASSTGGQVTFAATVSLNQGQDWLTLNPSNATTPANLTVTANGVGLTPGIYTGHIILSSPGVNPQTVDVMLTVSSGGGGGFTGAGSMVQVASAGFWTTTFTVVNNGTTPAQIHMNFFDHNGNPLLLPLIFPQMSTTPSAPAATLDRTLTAGSVLIVQTTGPNTQTVQTGWAELLYNGAIGALLQSTAIGLAAQGPTSFDLVSRVGIAPQRHGTLEFEAPAGGQISVLGLRFPPGPVFNTVPPLTITK